MPWPGTGRRSKLYDPLETGDVAVGDLAVPLESDLTTPLAYFLSNPAMSNLATAGLLRPDVAAEAVAGRQAPIMGLYMVQPYEPGKIPVLFVHGLWSSPMTWVEMFNDLRSCPEIRDRYQFWFYLYPTAQPFWISASRLRADLAEVRQVLDPRRQEPALDQMVVIAHSMGGLLARLQTIDSGNDFWNLVSRAAAGDGPGRSATAEAARRYVLFPAQSLGPPRGDHRHALPRQQHLQRRHPMALRQADQPAAVA